MLILNFIRGLSILIHLHDVVPNQTLNAEKIIKVEQLIQLREESQKNFRLAGIGTLTSAILASQLGRGHLIDS